MADTRTKLFEDAIALGISGTFTSGTHDLINERRIVGAVRPSHAGNLYVDHSADGANWVEGDAQAIGANTTVGFDQVAYGRYVRVRYANGATAQTSFRIFAYTSAV